MRTNSIVLSLFIHSFVRSFVPCFLFLYVYLTHTLVCIIYNAQAADSEDAQRGLLEVGAERDVFCPEMRVYYEAAVVQVRMPPPEGEELPIEDAPKVHTIIIIIIIIIIFLSALAAIAIAQPAP